MKVWSIDNTNGPDNTNIGDNADDTGNSKCSLLSPSIYIISFDT